MSELQVLVHTILSLPPADRSRAEVVRQKRARAKEYNQTDVPTNIIVLKTYRSMKSKWQVKESDWIEALLRKRSIRSQSGIVAVQVLTKQFWCPGKCIFCPNDATMPKSYINTQPWAMRALLNQFDPYKQVYNRLLSLTLTGHKTDKIEMIVLWGTRDVYPQSYKTEFIKWLYDACNNFTTFLDHIEIDFSSAKSARYTVTEDLEIVYPETVEESLRINETAPNRIIWLTVETRPEYVTDENCQYWRSLGVTRIEMGIQTLHNDVHEANVRWHDNQAIRLAMHKLRQYGFKISNHYMPGLYTSTPAKDLETFQIAFTTPWIKSDELKFYPTAVIPNTPLYDLYKEWKYTPIADEDLIHLIKEFKTKIIPPYARIKRLARDFDTNEVVAGANTPNLRQLVMNDMTKNYAEDQDLRKQQYSRLGSARWIVWIRWESDKSDEALSGNNSQQVTDMQVLLEHVNTPLWVDNTQHTSLSWETRDIDDRMETYTVWGAFDDVSERNFVCLCTRCREYRNKAWENDVGKKEEWKRSKDTVRGRDDSIHHPDWASKTWNLSSWVERSEIEGCDIQEKQTDQPFLVVRRYRSSNGEEMFVSVEDALWYLYGFARLLLPDEWVAIDYPGVEAGKALIRELHVYGKLESLLSDWSDTQSAQHKWVGRWLMDAAQLIATARWYTHLSVISGIWVKGYYKKLGYVEEGTYMVKELE